MYDVALKLCALMAVGLFAVGVLALASPRRLSRSYGVEVDDARALVWVRAAGLRDIILGVMLALAAYLDDGLMLVALCCACLLLALADFTLAFAFSKRLRSEHGAHIGGAIAFIVILALFMQTAR